MIKFIKARVFLVACMFSILFHLGIFAGMYMFHEPDSIEPDKNVPLLYNASLEYQYLPPDNHKKKDPGQVKPQVQRDKKSDIPVAKIKTKKPTEVLPMGTPEQKLSPDKEDESLPPITHTDNKEDEQAFTKERNSLFVQLQGKIKQSTVYPPVAKKRGLEGIVTVDFIIDKQGKLKKSEVSKSSGHGILDKAALKVIQRVLPFPHSLDRDVELTISIVYALY